MLRNRGVCGILEVRPRIRLFAERSPPLRLKLLNRGHSTAEAHLGLSASAIYFRCERSSSVTGDSPICVGAHQNPIMMPIKVEIASARTISDTLDLDRFSRIHCETFGPKSKMKIPMPQTSTPNAQTNCSRVTGEFSRSIVQNAARTGIPHNRAIHGPTKHIQRSAADPLARLTR